jgi:hypothetical protein
MMLVRVVRAVLGSVLLLVGLPLLLAGGALWFAMQHQDAGGAYTASLAEVSTEGYAVVASDVDSLLRRDVPFARGGRTTLRVTAQTETGPAFVGLAPAAEVARYLAGVPYTQITEVRLARGPLPVAVAPVSGTEPPDEPPSTQPFWLSASGAGSLEWAPSEMRAQQLALVVMDRDGGAPLTVHVAAEVRPQWLSSATFGSLVLGTVLVLVAIAALAWPSRAREIVYVVPPAQVPEIAAHLGVPVAPDDIAHPAPAETRPPPAETPPLPADKPPVPPETRVMLGETEPPVRPAKPASTEAAVAPTAAAPPVAPVAPVAPPDPRAPDAPVPVVMIDEPAAGAAERPANGKDAPRRVDGEIAVLAGPGTANLWPPPWPPPPLSEATAWPVPAPALAPAPAPRDGQPAATETAR